ncbi:MAG: branched-chain amino acid ABC transporter [Streptosporangiales bacterium]|nr:branched-chain amino acid ABC transporter [Streptosporangiales bacterium]
MIWSTIAGVALVTMLSKAVGPVALGQRLLPDRATSVIGLMAPALLAALVLVQVAGPHWSDFDPAMLVGLAAAGGAWYLRAPLPLAVVAGMAAAAALRALG